MARLDHHEDQGEATDQDMLATDLIPHPPQTLGQGKLHYYRPGYFLLQSSDCMMETYMLLVGVRVHEHW